LVSRTFFPDVWAWPFAARRVRVVRLLSSYVMPHENLLRQLHVGRSVVVIVVIQRRTESSFLVSDDANVASGATDNVIGETAPTIMRSSRAVACPNIGESSASAPFDGTFKVRCSIRKPLLHSEQRQACQRANQDCTSACKQLFGRSQDSFNACLQSNCISKQSQCISSCGGSASVR
jgi:hypothetical protein